MKGQLPNPVQEVYSSDGWTQWNPLLSTENRPAHISSEAMSHTAGNILIGPYLLLAILAQ